MIAASIEGVTKSFGPKVAVRELTLSIRAGECYGLIGPNGAGKTTTFSMLCGFLRPDHGRLRVLDRDPTRSGALKGKVGVLPQDAQLPSWARVGPLLISWARLMGLPDPERAAKACLEQVGLSESWMDQAGALSHGMAKRVGLAQALMGEPPVLLLDEPTAGLDPKVAAQIRSLVRDLKGQRTVIVSSHNLNELEELCDAAAILDHGKLVQAGSMAELTAKAAEFRVEIARGDVPLAEVRALRGHTGATLLPSGLLTVQFDGSVLSSEESISQTLALLLQRGVLVGGVTRGRKLEERVLQVT